MRLWSDRWPLESLERPPSYEVLGTDTGVQSVLYEGEPYRERPTRTFAYLGLPRAAAPPVPGVVCVHGGGGRAFKEWVAIWNARGYAAIAMDLAGKGPDGGPLPDGGPDQGAAEKFLDPQEHWADHWTYHSVAAILRAHSLLRAQPGVDPARVALTGISWGGYLTCIAAGVDDRFVCAAPVYGCGFLQHNSTWTADFAAMTEAQRRHWQEWCDPSVYLPSVARPTLFMNGTNDGAYPLDSYRLSYSLVPGPVTLSVRVRMPHGHPEGWGYREVEWFVEHHLKGGAPLPRIGDLGREGREVSAPVSGPRPLTGGLLAYTADPRPWTAWREREWRSVPAAIDGGRVHADLPEGAAAAFLAVTDDRGAYVSCPHLDRTGAAPQAPHAAV